MELLTGIDIKGLSQFPLNYCQDEFLTGFFRAVIFFKIKAGC